MNRFDGYLLKEWTKFLILFVFFLIGLFLTIDFLENNTRYFPKYSASPRSIFHYYLYQIPKLFVDLLPFNCMFATIFTCWIFARNGEFLAMRALGQSIPRLGGPLLALGIALSLASFWISEKVVPKAMARLRYTMSVEIEKNALGEVFLDAEWIRGSEGFLHFSNFDRITGKIEHPMYYKVGPTNGLEEVVYADSATFHKDLGQWVMSHARIYHFGSSYKGQLSIEIQEVYATKVTATPPKLISQQTPSEQLSYGELRRLIRESTQAGAPLSNREVDLFQKISLPFLNFLFILIALPFARNSERQKDTYIGIISCLVVAILFWIGNVSLRSISQNGFLNPLIAAWIMPLAVTAFGLINLWKLDKGI